MGADGYKKQGRIFEGENPYILLCPQCNDALEATNDNRCYCFGCGVVWNKSEIKSMCKFIGTEPIVDYEEGDI